MGIYLVSKEVFKEIVSTVFVKGEDLVYTGSVHSLFEGYTYVEYEGNVYLLDENNLVPTGEAFALTSVNLLESFNGEAE